MSDGPAHNRVQSQAAEVVDSPAVKARKYGRELDAIRTGKEPLGGCTC
jgi:hypothetical protein